MGVKRAWRLKSEADVQRVWQQGSTWTHPLLVLRARPNELGQTRLAFVVSKKIGKAVSRNRAKRLMREAARGFYPAITPGVDLVLIARPGLVEAPLVQVRDALDSLLARSGYKMN